MPAHNAFMIVETLPGEPSAGIQLSMHDGSVRLIDESPTDSGYANPSSFQIISQGDAEDSSRLFVGNLTYDSHDSTLQPSDWFVL